MTINVGNRFDIKNGVTATDTEDGELTSSLIVAGSVDLTKVGKLHFNI